LSFAGKDIIEVKDFSKDQIQHVFEVTDRFDPLSKKSPKLLDGRVMASLYFEPSTRTQFGFETAMLRLGGSCIGTSSTSGTSYEKGEDFLDGIRMIDLMADVMLIRHPEDGAVKKAADVAEIPIINCGDGSNEHPTQCFLELYTIRKLKRKLENLNIAFMGDLNGTRTTHSLVYGCAMFNMKLTFVSPKPLAMPEQIVSDLKSRYDAKIDVKDPREAIRQADILYIASNIMTSRFADSKGYSTYVNYVLPEYEKIKSEYYINLEKLKEAKEDLLVIHPLPRRGELSTDVDDTKYCGYWEMYRFAIPLRMACLALVLGAVE
jgi:aspartate carbamoyltransferase catalytic subunit